MDQFGVGGFGAHTSVRTFDWGGFVYNKKSTFIFSRYVLIPDLASPIYLTHRVGSWYFDLRYLLDIQKA